MSTKQVYKNPQAGQRLLTTISSGCLTPLLEVKFCNLVNPYRYPNSPTIPRYSVTCLVDPEIEKNFVKGIQAIEKDEIVDSIIKNDVIRDAGESVNSGKVLIKFQTKEIIPIYLGKEGDNLKNEELEQIELEDELAVGEKIKIVYEILRYTKKNIMKVEHGLSFKPTAIYYYPGA